MPLLGISERQVSFERIAENESERQIWVQLWETFTDDRNGFTNSVEVISSDVVLWIQREDTTTERYSHSVSFNEVFNERSSDVESFDEIGNERDSLVDSFEEVIDERTSKLVTQVHSERDSTVLSAIFDEITSMVSFESYTEKSISYEIGNQLISTTQRSTLAQRVSSEFNEINCITEGYSFKFTFNINNQERLLFQENINNQERLLFKETTVDENLLIDLNLIQLDDKYTNRGEILLVYRDINSSQFIIENLLLDSFFFIPVVEETTNTLSIPEAYLVFTESPIYFDLEYAPYDLEGNSDVSTYISFLKSQALLKVTLDSEDIFKNTGYKMKNYQKYNLVPFDVKIYNNLLNLSNNIFHLKWFYPSKSQKRNRISLIFTD